MPGDADLSAPQFSAPGGPQTALRAPDYRQMQEPEEIDTRYFNLASGDAEREAAARADALVGTFKDFSSGVSTLNNQVQQAAAAKGAAAGTASDGTPLTGLAAVTSFGSAYDAAAHLTYVNNARSSAQNSIDQIEQDTQGNPGSFAVRAQGVANAAIKNAPAVYAPELQEIYSSRIQAGVTRLRGQAITQAKSDAVDSYTTTVDSRIQSAIKTASALPADQQSAVMARLGVDNQTQLAALVKIGAVTPAHAQILAQKFSDATVAAVHGAYTTNVVDGMMNLARAGDVDAADHALHQYVTDPANTDADRGAIIKAYSSQIDEYTKAQSRLHASDIAGIGQQLVQGTGQPTGQGAYGSQIESQIHGLYKQGALSPELLRSLLDQSMRNQVGAINNSADGQLVDQVLHGERPKLDPADKSQVAAADTYFKTHVSLSGVPPMSDTWTAGVTAFARETNIVPPSALSQIRVGLLSGDPVQAARAAASAERIRAANPQLDPYDKDAHSAALAYSINQNLQAGMQPAQAVSIATQTLNRDEGQRKIVGKNYSAILRQNPDGNRKALQSALDAATPGMFAHAPPAPVPMQAEYERLVSTYYGLTQNIDQARTLAARQVQSTWGVSRMNGQPELTKYPPERLGISPDVIRNDVATSAKAAGYNGDPSQIHLVPNAYTDGSNGRQWSLVHTDPTTGLSDVLLDHNNRPLQYRVPQGPDFAKARQSLIQQQLAAARSERDQQRANSSEQIMFEHQLSNAYLSGNPQQRAQAGR